MRTFVKSALAGLVVAAGLLAVPARADAAPFGFTCISGTAQCSVEDQFSVEVGGYSNSGTNYVAFLFYNDVLNGLASSITDIYFDEPNDGSLPMDFEYGLQTPILVNYSVGAAPPNLPGGVGIGFAANHSFDSNPPVVQNGLNTALDLLLLVFALTGPTDYTDVIASLGTVGGLRIGLHVQAIAVNGGSASFVTNGLPPGGGDPPTVVPEPASMLLLGTGLAGVAAAARRRRRQRAEN